MKSYNEKSNEGYFIEAGVQYPENLPEPHNDLPFLPKIKKPDKLLKIAANLQDKEEYIMHIRNLRQALNHGVVFVKSLNLIK